MKILQRLRNLWKWSEYAPTTDAFNERFVNSVLTKSQVEKAIYKPAQIIKRTTPAQEFLKNNE